MPATVPTLAATPRDSSTKPTRNRPRYAPAPGRSHHGGHTACPRKPRSRQPTRTPSHPPTHWSCTRSCTRRPRPKRIHRPGTSHQRTLSRQDRPPAFPQARAQQRVWSARRHPADTRGGCTTSTGGPATCAGPAYSRNQKATTDPQLPSHHRRCEGAKERQRKCQQWGSGPAKATPGTDHCRNIVAMERHRKPSRQQSSAPRHRDAQ